MNTVKEIAKKRQIEIAEYFDFENLPCYDLVYTGSLAGTPEQNMEHALLQLSAEYLALPYVEEKNMDSTWAIVTSGDEYKDLMRLKQAKNIISKYEQMQ